MKPYMIILTGWGIENFVWSPFTQLLKQDYELIFAEWDNASSLDDFKRIVVQIIESKNMKSFSLIGWSLGSLVAQEIAHIYSTKIKCLILIGATSRFVRGSKEEYDMGWDKQVLKRMILELNRCPEETKFNFYNKLFSKIEKQSSQNVMFLNKVNNSDKKQSMSSLVLGLNYLINTDLRQELNVICVPILLIHGENDVICPLKAAEYMKNKSKVTQLEVIKDSGHIPFFTSPQKCYDVTMNFIKHLEKDDVND